MFEASRGLLGDMAVIFGNCIRHSLDAECISGHNVCSIELFVLSTHSVLYQPPVCVIAIKQPLNKYCVLWAAHYAIRTDIQHTIYIESHSHDA